MTRLLVWILLAALLVGGLIWLSRHNAERPLQRVEKVIPANALPR